MTAVNVINYALLFILLAPLIHILFICFICKIHDFYIKKYV